MRNDLFVIDCTVTMSQPARFIAEMTARPSKKEREYRALCRGQHWYDIGVEFTYFENLDPHAAGRWCCPKCTSYLQRKTTTVRRTDEEASGQPRPKGKAQAKGLMLGMTTWPLYRLYSLL